MNAMKSLRFAFLAPLLATAALASTAASAPVQDSGVVSVKIPDGVAPYDTNWSYADVKVPAGWWIKSIYGGFSRPGYPDSLQVFAAQFNSDSLPFKSLRQNRLWEYDSAHASLYDKTLNVSGQITDGPGTLRISLPTGKGAKWDILLVTLGTVKSPSRLAYDNRHASAGSRFVSDSISAEARRWRDGKLILPTIEMGFGFQSPLFKGGAIHSGLKALYPDDPDQYTVFNDGFAFYWWDALGFGYQESIGGSYFVPEKWPSSGNKITLSYHYSEWTLGGRFNVLRYAKKTRLEILLGYQHGFISTSYIMTDTALSRSVIGVAVPGRVAALGEGQTDAFTVDISRNNNYTVRPFLRASYILYAVDGYGKRLESGKTIQLSFGLAFL